MPGGELTDPVGYSAVWTLVAIVLPALVVTWYAAVTWVTRDRSVSHAPGWFRLWRARQVHLRELDRIEAAQRQGELSARRAHQAISTTVRSFVSAVGAVGAVDVRAMNLEQLRESGPPQVAAVVELVYPPAFEPRSEGDTDEQLGVALAGARELVTAWRV